MQLVVTPILDFFQQLFSGLSLKQYGLNTLDIIIGIVILFYTYEGYVLGFTLASIDLLSFILSFLLGLTLYALVGSGIVAVFSIPQGFANAIGFFIVALISEILITFLLRKAVIALPRVAQENVVRRGYDRVHHLLGILPGLASAAILLSFILTIVVALPSSPLLKELVTTSKLGGPLISHTTNIQQALSSVFGGAISDTFNVMTIKPESEETVNLHFTVLNPTVDEQSEEQMLVLINEERVKEGLGKVTLSEGLRELARLYSEDMFNRGYFSHYSPEKLSPFDRMNKSGITFVNAGENLALAPSVNLAHQGLMNSPGHRANILSPKFTKVGIGVMDGGIYGKMFTQEFTN